MKLAILLRKRILRGHTTLAPPDPRKAIFNNFFRGSKYKY